MIRLQGRAYLLWLGFSILSAQAHAQYQFVDLHPANDPNVLESVAYGTNSGIQVGHVFQGGTLQPVQWSGSASSLMYFDTDSGQGEALATDGLQAVGYSYGSFGQHALLWSVGNPSAVILQPSDWDYSEALAVSQGHQAGYVQSGGPGVPAHAAVWSGSAATFVDLNPPGLISAAICISGTDVGGYMVDPLVSAYGHAALWHGFNQTPVDLSPAPGDPTVGSGAYCVSANQQGGYVYFAAANVQHPVIWSGTAASMVELATDPAISGVVLGTNGAQQCGQVQINGVSHAAAWSGTPGSFVDLNAFVPGQVQYANATGIDALGNISGYAVITDPVTQAGVGHAVLWIYAPVTNHLSAFQQPINDPGSPESSFKRGSTVPVKFQLTDANGNPVSAANATISLTLLGSTEAPVNEADYTAPSDTGSAFRSSDNGMYIYNLGTKNLLSGARYRITATVGSASHSVTISLR